MNESGELELSLEDHQEAFSEVSFILDIFAATPSELMGGATASVGRIAGRHYLAVLGIEQEGFAIAGLEPMNSRS